MSMSEAQGNQIITLLETSAAANLGNVGLVNAAEVTDRKFDSA